MYNIRAARASTEKLQSYVRFGRTAFQPHRSDRHNFYRFKTRVSYGQLSHPLQRCRLPETSHICRDLANHTQHFEPCVYRTPDYLSVDQGSAYTSSEMTATIEAEGIRLFEAPVETPGNIYVVERYHGPLRVHYTKLVADLDRSTSDSECLNIAVSSVNSTIVPEGLGTLLLVSGSIPPAAR